MTSTADIRAWLIAAVAEELHVDPASIDGDRPLAYYGFDSLAAATVSGDLSEWLERDLAPELLMDYPTIDALAAHLADAPVVVPAVAERGSAVVDEELDQRGRVVRRIAAGLVRISSRLEVEDRGRIPSDGPVLFAVNHLHIFDALWMSTVLPARARFLVAGEFRTRPVIGAALTAARVIYIARGRADRSALDTAVEVLRNGGAVAIAPEGRLSRTGGLIKGHNGVAYLSCQSGVAVTPIAFWGQERAVRSWLRFSRVRVCARVGNQVAPPASTATSQELELHTTSVMRALALALPAPYRGIYGDHTPE